MVLPQLLKQEGLVTVMVMMLMMAPDSSEGHTTCTAITTVYNTSVTCLFAEDISRLSFNVQFFFPNTSVEPKMLLVCNRLTSGELTCHKGSQVLFDEKQKIADRFTFSRPPSLNKLNRGYYQCHAVPSLTERSQSCPLTYKDVPRLVPLESLLPLPKAGNDAIQVFMLVAVVISLILLIIMISAGFYLWAKRNSVALWCSRRAAEKQRLEDVENTTENVPLTGWKEALKDETTGMTADKPSPAKSIEPPTQPPVQHDKRDPQAEHGERRAAVDASQASRQSSQGVTLRPQPMRDRGGPRSKSAMVYSSPQRGQDDPRRQTPQPTVIAGEEESSEIQTEAAEEATAMLEEGSESKAGARVEETKENEAKGKGKGQEVNTGIGEQQRAATEEQGELRGKKHSDLKWYQLYEKLKRKYNQTTTV